MPKRRGKVQAHSAYLCDLCVEIIFNAEVAEIRRGPQRSIYCVGEVLVPFGSARYFLSQA